VPGPRPKTFLCSMSVADLQTVDSTYKVPFTFTGKVEKVTFDLK